jgi:hypothetical protein
MLVEQARNCLNLMLVPIGEERNMLYGFNGNVFHLFAPRQTDKSSLRHIPSSHTLTIAK